MKSVSLMSVFTKCRDVSPASGERVGVRGNQIKQIFLQKWRFLDLTFKQKIFPKKPRIILKKISYF